MLAAQFFEPRLERLDALADQTAVGFELRFARTAQADTAFLALEVSPRANQPRRQILQLRELDLQLAFVAAGALREDIENEAGAIDHTPIQRLLQIALLRRRERVIENDEFDVVRFARETQFFGLAAADEHLGIGARPAAGERDDGIRARTLREQAEFFETGFEIDLAEVDADKRCVDQIGGCSKLKRPASNSPTGDVRRPRRGLGLFGIRVEIHRTGRHDRRNCVLVDHLGDRIPEQHDVLVERFDVPLKLDAVDQVDRHRHMLFTQCVQKRVL